MILEKDDELRLAMFWVTAGEKNNGGLKEKREQLAKDGYRIAVFTSGEESLTENTKELLRYNKKLIAEKELGQAETAA